MAVAVSPDELEKRIQALERQVAKLSASERGQPDRPETPAARPPPYGQSYAQPTAPRGSMGAPTLPPAAATTPARLPAWEWPNTPATPNPSPTESNPGWAPAVAKKRDLEKLLGANWLARAGVLVLGLGVVFSLKLSYDNNWVPLAGRTAIGVAGGLALFILGDVLRTKRFDRAYPQVLAAGGAIITYATVYVAYALPEYRAALGMTLLSELAWLAIIGLATAGYAAWRNLPILAAVSASMAGILVAPAGDFSPWGVAFVGILGTGLAAACAWRGWLGVAAATLAILDLAFIVSIIAGRPDLVWSGPAIVVFHLGILAAAHRHPESKRVFANILAACAVLAMAAILALANMASDTLDSGWLLLLAALIGLAWAWGSRGLAAGTGVTGATLLALWPIIHFEGPRYDWLLAPAVLTGLALLAMAAPTIITRGRSAFRLASFAYLGMATVVLLIVSQQDALHTHWAGGLGAVIAAASIWLGLRPDMEEQTWIGGMAIAGGLLLCLPSLLYKPGLTALAGTIVAVGAVAVVFAARPAWTPRLQIVHVAGLLGGVWLLFQLWMLPGRVAWWTSICVLALVVLAAHAAARQGAGLPGRVMQIGHFALAGLLMAVWPWAQWEGSLWASLAVALGAAASLGAASVIRRQRTDWMLLSGALATCSVLSLWFMTWPPGLIQGPGIVAGLLSAGCLAALWNTARKDPKWMMLRITAMTAAWLALLVTTGQALSGWAIPVAWSALAVAATVVSFRSKERELRIAPFALFALVLGRIFLVDMAGLGLAERAIAFVATGILLLAGAWMYARQKQATADT